LNTDSENLLTLLIIKEYPDAWENRLSSAWVYARDRSISGFILPTLDGRS
jgi:hypothetical protein